MVEEISRLSDFAFPRMINTERNTWNTILKDFVAEATTEEDRAEIMKLNKRVGDQLKHMCATKMDLHFTHMHNNNNI